jgi:hypothetical protein
MIPRRALATASMLGAAWGCAANPDTTPALAAISPAMAYNDYPSPVRIQGDHLRPVFRFDTMAGAENTEDGAFSVTLTALAAGSSAGVQPIPLEAVAWRSPDELGATVPAGVPAGSYDVTVTDPRGHSTVLSAGFLCLGPDQQSPVLTIAYPEPRDIIGAETNVSIVVTADDNVGFLGTFQVTVSALGASNDMPCEVPPDTHRGACAFIFSAPTPAGDLDTVTISATATDNVGNPASTEASFRLAPRPLLTGLSPTLGPAAGGTRIEVYGTNFVLPTDLSEGTQLLLGGQVVTSAEVLTPNEITAVMPPHDPGSTRLSVMTGGAESNGTSFLFVAAPIVRAVSPMHGPATGGTPIVVAGNFFRSPATQIFIGSGSLGSVRYVSPNRIEGILPAGSVGPAIVKAVDPIGGTGLLGDVFTYDSAEAPAADGGVESTNDAGVP